MFLLDLFLNQYLEVFKFSSCKIYHYMIENNFIQKMFFIIVLQNKLPLCLYERYPVFRITLKNKNKIK